MPFGSIFYKAVFLGFRKYKIFIFKVETFLAVVVEALSTVLLNYWYYYIIALADLDLICNIVFFLTMKIKTNMSIFLSFRRCLSHLLSKTNEIDKQ